MLAQWSLTSFATLGNFVITTVGIKLGWPAGGLQLYDKILLPQQPDM